MLTSLTVWCHPASPTRGQYKFSGDRSASVQHWSPVLRSTGTCTFHLQTRGCLTEKCRCIVNAQKTSCLTRNEQTVSAADVWDPSARRILRIFLSRGDLPHLYGNQLSSRTFSYTTRTIHSFNALHTIIRAVSSSSQTHIRCMYLNHWGILKQLSRWRLINKQTAHSVRAFVQICAILGLYEIFNICCYFFFTLYYFKSVL